MSRMIRSRICFILLWILSLVGISFYGGNISYGFFFALTMIPVVSLVYLIFVYWRFRIYQEMEGRKVVAGQPVSYFFTLPNEDRFAFAGVRIRFFSSFSMVEELPENPEYELLPGDNYTYQTRITCKYRGEYEVGVKEVVINDFFGLFSFRYALPSPIKVTVLPRVIEIGEVESLRDMQVNLLREAYGADTEPDQVVRDYISGDPIKQIHWRASAKGDGLKVRGRIGEEKQGMAIVLDVGRYSDHMHEYLPAENRVLEVVLALGVFMAKKSIPFTTLYQSDSPYGGGIIQEKKVMGLREFEHFYEDTSEIVFANRDSFAQTLGELMTRGTLYPYRILFLVVQRVDADLLQLTDELGKNGKLVVIYVIGEEDPGILHENNERRKILFVPADGDLEGGL